MTLFTFAQKGGFHLSAKPAEAMGGEYIPMILSLQLIIVLKKRLKYHLQYLLNLVSSP